MDDHSADYPYLEDVNRTDVADAVALATGPMQSWFDWDHGGLPLFQNEMFGPEAGNRHHPSYSMSHVPGRWLDALLNAEAVFGTRIDRRIEANLRHWLLASLDNPMNLPACLDLRDFRVIPLCDLHNLRETMHGIAALCQYRQDQDCARLGEKMIETVDTYLDFETGAWDERRFNRERGSHTFFSPPEVVDGLGWNRAGHVEGLYVPQTFGRYLGALTKFYIATGSRAAFDQALRLRNLIMHQTFADPSRYDVALHGLHTHSVTSTISGLARFAAVIEDGDAFERIEQLMSGLLQDMANETGWCTERFDRPDDYGEVNNTADMVETYLILGGAGRHRYFQSAEKMIRSHYLPSQLRDTRFVTLTSADLASRSRGAFGFPCPYGLVEHEGGWISYNWDIVGGGVSGLCEVFRNAVRRIDDKAGRPVVTVTMPLDGTFGALSMTSPYTEGSDALRITLRQACTLHIHLSDWCKQYDVNLGGARDRAEVTRLDSWVVIDGLEAGDEITLAYALVERQQEYRIKSGTIRAYWRGDEVCAMDVPAKPPLRFIPARL